MKKLLLAFAAGVCLSACATHDPKISIVPYPNHLEPGHGTFAVKGEGVVCDSRADERTQRAVAEFAAQLAKTSGGENPVTVANELPASGIRFVLDQTLPEEGYRLDVTPKGVEVRASRFPGFFYAVQSLRQMLPAAVYGTEPAPGEEWVLPCVSIEDAPRFVYRGMHLDVARHFFSVEEVKRYLDVMAIHKLNRFHWHLTDDQGWRIEIKKYPELTTVGSIRKKTMIRKEWDNYDNTPYGGYYTQDEIRDIVKYADDRGIKVIPEIEVPGHASASIYAYPWIGATSRREGKAVVGDLYDVTDPKVEEFLHDILDEVVALFPSKIVHIGGDEANYTHWQNSEEIQAFMKANGLPTCSDLQVWAINRMSKYLASKGCRMIGWNEITGETVREGIQASQSEQLAPGTIVPFWDGDVSLVNKAIAKGYDVVNSNRFFTYVDYAYEVTPFEKAYSFDPIPEGLAEKDKKKILGLGCQMWGEYTPTLERVYYQTYPRIAAFAESGWTAPEKKSYPDFRKRLKKIEAIWKEKGYIKTQIGKY